MVIMQEMIKLGAVTLVVPGNLPIGCLAAYLTDFQSSNQHDYDTATGCINWLNDLAKYHNRLLQKELNRIRTLHPHATIIYADYYNAAMRLYRSPITYGISPFFQLDFHFTFALDSFSPSYPLLVSYHNT